MRKRFCPRASEIFSNAFHAFERFRYLRRSARAGGNCAPAQGRGGPAMLRIAFPSERNPATAGREKPIEIPAEYRLQNILFVILQGVMCAPPPRAAEITSFQALSKPESPTKLPAEPAKHRQSPDVAIAHRTPPKNRERTPSHNASEEE